jgi:hypothetical protein
MRARRGGRAQRATYARPRTRRSSDTFDPKKGEVLAVARRYVIPVVWATDSRLRIQVPADKVYNEQPRWEAVEIENFCACCRSIGELGHPGTLGQYGRGRRTPSSSELQFSAVCAVDPGVVRIACISGRSDGPGGARVPVGMVHRRSGAEQRPPRSVRTTLPCVVAPAEPFVDEAALPHGAGASATAARIRATTAPTFPITSLTSKRTTRYPSPRSFSSRLASAARRCSCGEPD